MRRRATPRAAVVSDQSELMGSVQNQEGHRRSARIIKKSVSNAAPSRSVRPSQLSSTRSTRVASSSRLSTTRTSSEISNSSHSSTVPLRLSRSSSDEIISPVRTINDTGPPPARRLRTETRQVTPDFSSNTDDLRVLLGLSVQEYEAAIRAEQELLARSQQIQQDNAMASRLHLNPDNLPDWSPSVPNVAPSTSTTRDENSTLVMSTPKSSTLPTIVEESDPCTICLDDKPKNPFCCRFCSKVVGCYKCVKIWFREAPKNNQLRNCPLCRHLWNDLASARKTVPKVAVKRAWAPNV